MYSPGNALVVYEMRRHVFPTVAMCQQQDFDTSFRLTGSIAQDDAFDVVKRALQGQSRHALICVAQQGRIVGHLGTTLFLVRKLVRVLWLWLAKNPLERVL